MNRLAASSVFPRISSLALVVVCGADGARAQQNPGEPPHRYNAPFPVFSLRAEGLGYGNSGVIEHFSLTQDVTSRAGAVYGVATGRNAPLSPRRAQAFWYDPRSEAVTLVGDVSAITRDQDFAASCDPSLKVLVMWTASGVQYSTRNAVTGPWGSLAPVTGIPSNSFTATPCWLGGKLKLMYDDALNNISIGDFNSTTGAVTNTRTLVTNPATGPSFFCHSPTPQNDDQGEMRAVAFTVRQRGLFNSSAICTTHRLDDRGDKHKVFEAGALYQPGGFIGGSLYSSRLALGGGPPNASTRMDILSTSCVNIPAAGGPASFFLWASTRRASAFPWVVVLMFGARANPSLELPGINGKLSLRPDSLVLLDAMAMDLYSGFSRRDIELPALGNLVSIPMQPAFVDDTGIYLGNTAWATTL